MYLSSIVIAIWGTITIFLILSLIKWVKFSTYLTKRLRDNDLIMESILRNVEVKQCLISNKIIEKIEYLDNGVNVEWKITNRRDE